MDEPLWRLSATAVRELVASRAVSAREVAEAVIGRMDAVNPDLNAVVVRFDEEVLAEADRVDAALAGGAPAGPLAGVPITIKVIADQAGHATTNGLRLLRDHVAAEDAPVVANLRRAGAVIVGRTNTPAFSVRWFTRSALHGATRNPHDATITPGGSSGGASSAVAAGIGAIAHGTDIAGSVRYPAYACNLHGLRPSLGRVPQVNPAAADRTIGPQIMAVSGPLARRMDDIELALGAMAAGDARDVWWVPAPLTGPPLPRRVALVMRPDGMAPAPEVVTALEDAATVLEAAGYAVEPVEAPPLAEGVGLNIGLWMGEFRFQGLGRFAEEADPDVERMAPWLLERAMQAPGVEEALQRRMGFVRSWQQFVANWPLVLCPVSAEVPFPDHFDVANASAFDRVFRAQLTQIALPVTGLPSLAVATGRPGAPMGVQLIAPRFREDVLIEAGRVIEAAHPPILPVDPFVVGEA